MYHYQQDFYPYINIQYSKAIHDKRYKSTFHQKQPLLEPNSFYSSYYTLCCNQNECLNHIFDSLFSRKSSHQSAAAVAVAVFWSTIKQLKQAKYQFLLQIWYSCYFCTLMLKLLIRFISDNHMLQVFFILSDDAAQQSLQGVSLSQQVMALLTGGEECLLQANHVTSNPSMGILHQ